MNRPCSSTNSKRHLRVASSALLVSLTLLLYSHTTQSAPYQGTTHSFVQPDGSTITLRLFGDEYYLRAETLDGYTVVRDEQTGWISYAVYDEAVEALISTGIPFENSTNATVDLPWVVGEKHQRLPLDLLVDKVNDNHQRLFPGSTQSVAVRDIDGVPTAAPPREVWPAPTGTVSGEIISLTVIVDFSDAPAPLPLSAYEAYFNDLNWKQDGNAMSIRRYYSEVSFGKVDLKNIVRGIYRAKKTFAEYDAMAYAAGAKEILTDVLGRLNNEGFDFSQLTTVGGKIQALNFMFTGNPKAWAKGMWFHQGWLSYSADGVTTGKYACGSAKSPLEIFTAIHENGHMVGNWPDTYNYNGGTEPIGNFCIMGGGGKFPPPPNPAFRTMAGWSNVIDVTGREGVWQSTANDNTIYKYRNSSGSTEYYLFEARKKDTWLHKNIPDEGLTIWHVDTNGDQQNLSHLMVELMHGDNDWKDKEDACFHAGGAVAFNDRTTPDAHWWSGANSGLDIHSISSAGTTMSFTTGRGGVTDQCPADPNKTEPGQCGCGTPDTDSDGDGTANCKDGCPSDPKKTAPGLCGCGIAEGTCGTCTDNNSNCPSWAARGECQKNPGYMLVNCKKSCNQCGATDQCPNDPNKTQPGLCGCGVPDGTCNGDELYQAEEFTTQYGTTFSSKLSGFTGTGFMDYGGNGTWIEWNNVYVSQPGQYTLAFRYAVGSSGARQAEAIINGATQGNIGFATTGTWETWKINSIVVTLKKGNNIIRIKANTNNGGPNLDKMTIAFGRSAPDSRSTQSEQLDDQDETDLVYEGLNCSVSRSTGIVRGSWLLALLRLLF